MEDTIILFGGQGSERLVSVASAQNIATNLDAALWFWDAQGAVYVVSRAALLAHQKPFENDFTPQSAPVFPNLEEALDSIIDTKPVIFLAVHGGKGEDGTLQGWLEKRGIRFTGSGKDASERAFNKIAAKDIAQMHNIRIARSMTCSGSDADGCSRLIADARSEFGDIVVKPVESGSSDGLHFLNQGDDSATLLDQLSIQGETYLIEERIVGREITVGIVEHTGTLLALPPSEVLVGPGASFDYAAKYLGGATEITPANLSLDEIRASADIAKRVHTAIGCRGYSRTDLILSSTGFVFLEINTLPGLTKASFIPQQLEAAHIPMKDFVNEQLEIARTTV